jgi:phosphoribosyl-dephospho-CoA transferase
MSEDKLVELNKLGMESLSQGNTKMSMEYLKMAEKLVYASRNVLKDEYTKLYSLTMNNLGCYYKK